MIAQVQSQPLAWEDLKDENGKLYARLEPRLWLLEVRRNHQTVIFDLRDGRVRMKEYKPVKSE